jgi:hypothetical protein
MSNTFYFPNQLTDSLLKYITKKFNNIFYKF